MVFVLVTVLALAALAHAQAEKRAFLEHSAPLSERELKGWTAKNKPTSDLEFQIALHPNNVNRLEALLLQRSDPTSAAYGQWLSFEEINWLVAPSEDALSAVHAWIDAAGARVVELAPSKDWIKITASVAAAEQLLATEFHEFEHKNAPSRIVRAVQPYSVPLSVAKHVAFVTNVHTFPGQFADYLFKATQKARAAKRQATDPPVAPADLRRRYNVSSTVVNRHAKNTQAVAEFQAQYYAPSDLQQFFQQFVPGWSASYANNVVVLPPGSNMPNAPGTEAELDIEFIMGVAPNVTTTFYASATFDFWSGLATWAQLVASQPNPPLVISVSYGDQSGASKPSLAAMKRIDVEFQKLGVRGITIVFASGDSGAGCDYCLFEEPSFPATSPNVLSVGATRFIGGQLNGPEMAVNEFGSGGGFAWSFPQAAYQSTVVQSYLTKYKSSLPYWFSFNPKGRATPDVAALGIGFQVVQGGGVELVGGTSASAPTFAALITLLNAARFDAGKSSLGFINPWIYQTQAAHPETFFDVTRGDNFDSCCIGGYSCEPGWDPVTGLGTPNFRELVKHI